MSVEPPAPLEMKGVKDLLDEADSPKRLAKTFTKAPSIPHHEPSRTSNWLGATSHIVTGAPPRGHCGVEQRGGDRFRGRSGAGLPTARG